MAKSKQRINDEKARAFGEVWKPRLERSRGIRKERLESYDSMMKILGGEEDEAAQKKVAEGQAKQAWVPYAKLRAYVMSAIPSIIERYPSNRVGAVDWADDSAAFAACARELLNVIAKENRRVRHMRLVTKDGLAGGLGVFYHGWSQRLGLPFSRHQPLDKFLIDPEATGAPGTAAWMGREVILPLDAARKAFNRDDLGENCMIAAGAGLELDLGTNYAFSGADASAESSMGNRPGFKIAVVWRRAGGPENEDLRIADDEWMQEGDTDGSPNAPKKLILNTDTGELLHSQPWGFVLDREEFPFTLFQPELDPKKAWARGPLEHLRPIQRVLSTALSLGATRAVETAALLYGFDPDSFDDPAKVEKAIEEGADRGAFRMKNGADIKRAIQMLDMGSLSPELVKLIDTLNRVVNDLTNYDNLFSSDSSLSGTAHGAEISERRRQTALMNFAVEADETVEMVGKKDLQIAMSRMPRAEVAKRVKKWAQGDVWPENPSIYEIRAVDVNIEAGSMSSAGDEAKATHWQNLSAKLNEFIAIQGNKGRRLKPEVEFNLGLEPIRRAARLLGADDFASMVPTAEDFEEDPPPPPPPPPAPPMPPEPPPMPMGPPQPGPMDPASEAAVLAAAMGLPPEALAPPMM